MKYACTSFELKLRLYQSRLSNILHLHSMNIRIERCSRVAIIPLSNFPFSKGSHQALVPVVQVYKLAQTWSGITIAHMDGMLTVNARPTGSLQKVTDRRRMDGVVGRRYG